LTTHARFAADQGVPQVIEAKNGTIVRLAPDPAEIIDEAFVGRVFRDGTLVVKPEASGVAARRKASFAGVVVVAIVIDGKGGMPVDPEVSLIGLPEADRDGVLFQDRVEDAVDGVWDSLPKAKRRDLETVREAMKKAVRAEVNMRWGKKPIVDVVILEL
jgi:ribonuclease J